MARGPDGGIGEAAKAIQLGLGEAAPRKRGAAAEIRRQCAPLKKWAQRTGRIVDYSPPADAPASAGAEHQVFVHKDEDRFYKRTYPGTFGSIDTENGVRRVATPYFYLRRLELHNRIFDSGLRFEGITPGTPFSAIISQPAYYAADADRPQPTLEQVEAFMRQDGFVPGARPFTWVRAADGIQVSDARPDNFILTRAGVVPIDLIISDEPPGAVAATS